MDRNGIDHAVVMGMGWTDYDVAAEANDYIIDAVSRNPERLTGFASVNPAWGEGAVQEAQRCADAGLRGIGGLHPDTQGIDIGDAPNLKPLMDTALSLRLPVLQGEAGLPAGVMTLTAGTSPAPFEQIEARALEDHDR